ncbi:uncharacterized protein [Physcomitrium patens]|uniref:WD40 repeat-containing protein SMU1 n=2 Tax=Physcomitrium patens TaxID=3218 RepID=A0A2K1JXU0_PHYPA|nr:pre-mRNA-splicing factor PRP46-like [Physcomitrium patens]PNR46343.1 hypothetical protein PHYPA_013462 [Physcomitrium patens]|eukprot:XP_024385842.1 pre-mRNA-splicing factor PRP46-like [Physcomitrella patens]
MADSTLASEILRLSLGPSALSSSASTSRQDANGDDNVDLTERARAAVYAGPPRRTIGNDDAIFDHDDPRIKEDIIRMIVQYLQDEGYVASIMTIQDEASVRFTENLRNRSHFKRIKAAILDGEWVEMEKLVQKTPLKDHKHFLYTVYKQQYLELIEQLEYQKAFALLTKRLKPLEQMGSLHNEFKDLCYLLTCKSIQDAPFFKTWEGVASSREKLVEQFSSMLEIENNDFAVVRHEVQPQRLLHLLKQAVRYQIEFSRYHPKVVPSVPTLLEDYSCFVLPNAHKTTFRGHRCNVKCVEFVGEEGTQIVSGSSDNTLRVWDVEGGRCVRVLGDGEIGSGGGHTSRIWDVSSSSSGDFIASASGDSTVKFWNLRGSSKSPCSATLTGHEGDVYSVKYHQSNNYVVTGGYDKTVKLWDARTGSLLRTFSGHKSSVSRVIFNPLGNLVISGSKDSTIKFWDLVSGVCIKTYSSHLGEVTSVEMNKAGSFLLSASKDNSNRLWDVRLARPIRRFKGHQNTSKNFVRASFGPDESLVVGGSEDGFVYIWDTATGEILHRLGSHSPESHTDIAYRAVWNAHQSLLVSCSHDGTVKTWWYDEQQPWDQDCDF